jgi:hypothetical protein
MQTFLPYADFDQTASVLDYRRLGKQRVEVKQILLALDKTSGGWVNHPAVKMWRGYDGALLLYGMSICTEWITRGYRDTLFDWFQVQYDERCPEHASPAWLGNGDFHRSHQSNLVRKDADFYRVHFPDVPDDLEYVWPI